MKKQPLKTNGQLARSDHPEDWSTLPDVLRAIRFGIGQYPGLALGADYPLRVLDLDRCIDQDGTPSPLATDIVNRAGNTYIERSVSGRGLHVFTWKSDRDYPTHPASGLEVYGGAPHFIVMTGDLWKR